MQRTVFCDKQTHEQNKMYTDSETPSSMPFAQLPQRFSDFFCKKIGTYNRTLTVALALLPLVLLISFLSGKLLTHFSAVSETAVSAVLKKMACTTWPWPDPYMSFVQLFWWDCSSIYPCCKWISALRHIPNSIQTCNCQTSSEKKKQPSLDPNDIYKKKLKIRPVSNLSSSFFLSCWRRLSCLSYLIIRI